MSYWILVEQFGTLRDVSLPYQVTPTTFNCAPSQIKNKIGDTLRINFRRTRERIPKKLSELYPVLQFMLTHEICCSYSLDPAPYFLLCDILFSSALIVAIYRPALSFIIVSSLFLTHGAGSIIITMLSLHFHNIICICNSGSAIKDHPTITPTNITTKLSAPLQSSSNINKSNLLALIDEILLSELLFDIERQVESKNINISIVHWPSSSSLLLLLPYTIYNQPDKLVYIKRSFLINID